MKYISVCQYCNESFNKHTNIPFLLKCGHFFCKQCIEGIFTDKRTKNIYCPKDNVIVAKSFKDLKLLKNFIYDENMNESKGVRFVNQNELEILHNIPKGYTRNLTKTQAGNLIGDGWTVGIVEHIFSFLPPM